MNGTVKFYNEQKGYGFITDTNGKDVFIHASKLSGLHLKKNDEVIFETSETKKGTEAISVKKKK